MQRFINETPEDMAFRKHMEAMHSCLDAAKAALLPAGTDFHVCIFRLFLLNGFILLEKEKSIAALTHSKLKSFA